MRKHQLIAAFLVLAAIMGIVGCSKKAAFIGSYSIIASDELKKKQADLAEAMAKANPSLKAQIDLALKDAEQAAASTTVTFDEDGTCTFKTPGKPKHTSKYTFVNGKVTITAMAGAPGATSQVVLTWDEPSKTLTAEGPSKGLSFKKL